MADYTTFGESAGTRELGLPILAHDNNLAGQGRPATTLEDVVNHELAHRMRNQLQILLSYTELVAGSTMTKEQSARRTSSYINALIQANDQLYRQDCLDWIEARGFLSGIVHYLEVMFRSCKKARFHAHIANEALPADLALTIGLALTEMITAKFIDQAPMDQGVLTISFRRRGEEWVLSLANENCSSGTVSRDETPVIAIEPTTKCQYFGSMILSMLVCQMKGKLECLKDRTRKDMLIIPIPHGWNPDRKACEEIIQTAWRPYCKVRHRG
jgi:two-component sensor histidine kinase